MKRITMTIAALFAMALSCMAGEDTAAAVPADTVSVLVLVAGWYGALCVLFNALTSAVSAFVLRTPSQSDDAAIERFYESKIYKALSWVFSWGDYIAEAVIKSKK